MGQDYLLRRTVLQSLAAAGLLGLSSAGLQSVGANKSAQTRGAWSQFQADAGHSGATDAQGPTADNLDSRWEAVVQSTSNPVVVDGRVYVTERNYANAFDAATGEPVWEHELNSKTFYTDLYPLNTPAVVDGSVYVTSEGGVASLDAATGEQEWLVGHGTSLSPTVADGSVYAAAFYEGAGKVLFSLTASDGTEQWRFDPSGKIMCSPAVSEGTVYIAAGSEVYALDAATGDEQWQVSYPDISVWGTPTVVDGTVYVLGGDGNNGSCVVVALDAETGDLTWDATAGQFPGGQDTSPAVAAGTVYASIKAADTDDDPPDIVVAFDAATGEEQWRFGGNGRAVTTPPVIAGDTLYVGGDGAEDGFALFALDAATGTEVTRFWTDDDTLEYPIAGAPSVSDGTVFVPTYVAPFVSSMYAIEAGGEPPETPPDPAVSAVEDTTGACDPIEFEVSFPDRPTTDTTRFLYRWKFAGEDGQDLETSGATAQRTYDTGKYDVRVVVENQYGATKTASTTVTVKPCEEELPTETDESKPTDTPDKTTTPDETTTPGDDEDDCTT